MDKKASAKKIETHLQVLCSEIGERRVGSEGNRRATTYAKRILQESGWQVTETELSVMDWKTEGAALTCGEQSFEIFSSHYSTGCSVQGELIAVNSARKLGKTDIRNKIVLLYGEIAARQIAPKNFPFWNPEEDRQIISLLEQAAPKALIAATERNSTLAGGVYPFPLFEDGDFHIPSVYMKDTEGEKLLACTGQIVKLESKAVRIPGTAYNITARQACPTGNRIVITAHVDTKPGTPGAIDNGTGVAIVLLLAELLKGTAKYPVELALLNGEDYYAAPGQMAYIRHNADKFDDIYLNINIDGVGYKEGYSCFSAFGLSAGIQNTLHTFLRDTDEIREGLPWYQGDHSLFLQHGRPAIAVCSQWLIENMECQDITHTSKDNLDIVNYERAAECAIGIADLLEKL